MTKKLREYFPMLRTRNELLSEIGKKEELLVLFDSWKEEQQEEFLDFCSGARGVKILYDSFFKEIFSPEYHPERVERFLSLILCRKVRIIQILPNDSTRIADECTLLITDIVVELEDGSIANIEIQKIGYAFPGERSACYSADMLLRQYKRIKGRRKKNFTYRDIKTVYTIVLFEKSTREFHEVKGQYIHRGKQIFSTGLQLNMLQEYVLIPLDIFKNSMHNKIIESELDAWLAFLSYDEPEKIVELLEMHPEFRTMYEEIYQMCLNIEEVMHMFSKELRELDRNTVQYMIEEQEKEIKEQEKEIKEQEKEIKEQDREIKELKEIMQERDTKMQEQGNQIREQNAEIAALKKKLASISDE